MSVEKCEHDKPVIDGYICKECSLEIANNIKDGFFKAMDNRDRTILGDTIENIAKKLKGKKK